MASINDILLLYELSNQKGSTLIGYHGSNLQTQFDNHGQFAYWLSQMAPDKFSEINVVIGKLEVWYIGK